MTPFGSQSPGQNWETEAYQMRGDTRCEMATEIKGLNKPVGLTGFLS